MTRQMPKSQKRIINAFIEMRKTMPLEKLSVTKLCQKADVNKSTFYVYYHDIYDLSLELESQLVDNIVTSIRDPKLIISDVYTFSKQLHRAYQQQKEMLTILFSDSRSASLPEQIFDSICEIYYKMRPESRYDLHTKIILEYSIYGGYYSFKNHLNDDSEYISNIIADLSSRALQDEDIKKE
ncbi:MAG: TetR/AcrR family transcriptional regulator [Erysipelotrichaceae bacterium]|nr:TetR/AcrR family transcriptional regulator [Erysipelotrichaceae bacterium]